MTRIQDDGQSLTPDGFRNLLSEIGLSQQEAARLIGVTERAIRRWARGDAPIPDIVHEGLLKVRDRM